MSANIAAQSSPRAGGMLRVRSTDGGVLLKSRHGQQTRAYRFGMWSSYFDPEFHRDIRRRHRMLKHKYAESLDRQLKWDRDHFPESPRALLQRVMNRYWYPNEAYYSSRIVNAAGARHFHGKKPKSEGAGHVRVHASSNYLFGDEFDPWKSEPHTAVDSWTKKQMNKGTKRAKSTSSISEMRKDVQETAANTTQAEEEYVIDPITNRKVLKKSYGSFENVPSDEASARSFRSYRSQFSMFTPPEVEEQPRQQPVHSNGPPPAEELSKYNDVDLEPDLPSNSDPFLGQSSAVQSEEYSLNHLPPEEAAEILEDVDKYKPSEYDAIKPTTAGSPQKYDDLHKYKPDGYDPIQSIVASHSQKYDDLHKYKSSQYDEVLPAEESSQKYEDLHEYNPARYNESTAPEADPSAGYGDLHKYRPYMHNENATVVEKSTPQYEDLEKYEKYENEQESVGYGEVAERYEDLDKYNPSEFLDGARDEDSTPEYKDLDKYSRPYLHQEDKLAPESQHKYNDLDSYKPQDFNDHVSGSEEKLFEQYGDLDKYKAYRFQEPEGQAVLEQNTVDASLTEFDAKIEARQNLEQSLEDHITASDAADKEASTSVHISRRRSDTPLQSSITGNFVRDFPEEFSSTWSSSASGLQREGSSTSAHEQEVEASVQHVERSFSEGLSRTANASVLQTALDRHQPKSRIETSLDRQKTPIASRQETPVDAYDPFSKQPQGLETSYKEECSSTSSKPPFVKMYGTLEKTVGKEDMTFKGTTSAISLEELLDDIRTLPSATAISNSDSNSPTLYKILVYDPTMRSVSVAETTSIVPDQATPLTPAEVLLRLSSPAKFFPYFAPLQAQGFEIISGSGDVLVFRRTREVSPSTRTPPINPIDMMGAPSPSPSAAAFASPTGFVNYDAPQPVQEQRPPPFHSGIDVRREEPVFSGPKTTSQHGSGKTRKKQSITKRALIGGVWIAGLSYSLGVIGEYFTTGGIDGRGPTGF